MGLPKSVTKIDRKGNVTYKSNVDQINYTLNELTRAALRDVAKFLRKKLIDKLKTLPGMKRSRRIYKSTQYWVRSKEADLQIGFGNTKKGLSGDSWYAARQELGTKKMKRKGFLRDTVFENISQITDIQAQYLSGIKDINDAQKLIDESEAISGDGDEP